MFEQHDVAAQGGQQVSRPRHLHLAEDEKGAFNQTMMDLQETIQALLNPSEADPHP